MLRQPHKIARYRGGISIGTETKKPADYKKTLALIKLESTSFTLNHGASFDSNWAFEEAGQTNDMLEMEEHISRGMKVTDIKIQKSQIDTWISADMSAKPDRLYGIVGDDFTGEADKITVHIVSSHESEIQAFFGFFPRGEISLESNAHLRIYLPSNLFGSIFKPLIFSPDKYRVRILAHVQAYQMDVERAFKEPGDTSNIILEQQSLLSEIVSIGAISSNALSK